MLTRMRQIGGKIQTTPGTAETLIAADFSNEPKDIEYQLPNVKFERDTQRGTLTRREDLRSQYSARISFSQEMVGGSLAAGAPWHRDLRASGMSVSNTAVFQIPYTSRTGAFKPGDILGNNASQASATKTLMVAFADPTTIMVFQLTGGSAPANTETYTNYSRTGSYTQNNTAVACGYAFRFKDDLDDSRTEIATYEIRDGGERIVVTDAQGTASLMLRLGEPPMLRHEITGIPKTSNDTGTLLTGSRLAAPVAGVKPIRCQGIPLEFLGGASPHTPKLTALEISFNNEVTLQETMTNVDVAQSGHCETRIVNRDPSATIDPLYIAAAAGFDWEGANRRGESYRIYAVHGSVSHGNGMIVVVGPQAQIEFEGLSDRKGEKAINPTLKFRGDVQDELYIFHLFLPS
jgi:hypothetical protein